MTMDYVMKARSRTAARELDAALRRFEPRVAAAFLAAAKAVRSRAVLREIARAIERGDLERAVELTGAGRLAAGLRGAGLDPGARTVQAELIDAFRRGGTAGMRQFPRAAGIAASLDLTNPEAVLYLRDHVPALIRQVGAEAREAVRQALARGMTEGRPAILIAREIRDAVDLTAAQSHYVGNLRRQLETGDVGNATAPWDRRLSAVERQRARSIMSAGGERSTRVDALVSRYHDSLVNRRARNIARTEVHRAFVEGQDELWRQATAEGLIDPATTRRVWIVTPDDRLRPDHAAVPGMNPSGVALGEQFQTPVGPVDGPGQSGDPAFDIGCRCTTALEFRDL